MTIPEMIEEVKKCFDIKFKSIKGNIPDAHLTCDAYRLGKILEAQKMGIEIELLKDRAARISSTLSHHDKKKGRK